MIEIQTDTRENPPKSDVADKTGDGRREPDSGLGYTQDYQSLWQTEGEERGAEGRPAGDRISEIPGIRRNSQWDFPRRRALFASDGTNSMTSESDTPEGYADRPPAGGYLERRMTEKQQDEGGTERLVSPHVTLERAVIQLQKDLDNCRTEFEITRKLTPAVNRRQPRQAGFTSILVLRYSGKSNWEQYRDIFEAIVCSNGWDDVTAALQLLSHLDGDALNVPAGRAGFFDKLLVRPLQLSGTPGGIQAPVSVGGPTARR